MVDFEPLGTGGYGTVYRARQPALGRTVALKVLHTTVDDESARARFDRECVTTGRFASHPNIVTLFESGYTDEGRPYLVMELQAGGSLAERLVRTGPLPWPEVTALGVRLAGALETAHRAGVLHRDLKPANVLLSRYGHPQLADFGIARLVDGPETRSTKLSGSLDHSAPETLRGKPATVASDLYGFGSTLHTLLAGAPPFRVAGDQASTIVERILTALPPDLRRLGVPDDLARVIEALLAKAPEARPASALEVGRALRAVQRAHGYEPTALPLLGVDLADDDEVTPAEPVTTGEEPSAVRQAEPRTRRGLVLAAVAGLVIIGGVVAALALRGGTDVEQEPEVADATEVAPVAVDPTVVATTAAPTATRAPVEVDDPMVALAPALLTVGDLPGEGWGSDELLVGQWEANPSFMLCRPNFGDAPAVAAATVGFRGGGATVPAQVGHAAYAFADADAATTFTDAARANMTALTEDCGHFDVNLDEIADVGDEAFLISYAAPRAASGGLVTNSLAFIRLDHRVSQLVGIAPPGTTPVVDAALIARAGDRLAALPAPGG